MHIAYHGTQHMQNRFRRRVYFTCWVVMMSAVDLSVAYHSSGMNSTDNFFWCDVCSHHHQHNINIRISQTPQTAGHRLQSARCKDIRAMRYYQVSTTARQADYSVIDTLLCFGLLLFARRGVSRGSRCSCWNRGIKCFVLAYFELIYYLPGVLIRPLRWP